ncbi:MAG: hypothetical protein U9Q38_08760, partial [Thermodesulfobacteriota bacterium]|nr:hypothetical protein [Thermodesulfobacteriota bacterium]
ARHVEDLLVDAGNSKLYAITYYWGAEELHAVGNVYVQGLNADGSISTGAWVEANIGLPEFSDEIPTLLAQHVMAPNIAGSPTSLYIGGEGISLSKASSGLMTGEPVWQSSQDGLTNLIMARMPILFTGPCTMGIDHQDINGVHIFKVYIEDSNGNPPISGSRFVVQKTGGESITLMDITYPDTYVSVGTWRDRSDTTTNNPFVISTIIGTDDEIEFVFTPANNSSAPGSSGSIQTVTY